MDRFDFQQAKLNMMPDWQERELALMLWRAQAERERAEDAIAAYYEPLVHACSSIEELDKIIERMPDMVTKSFVVDYRNYGRDWSMSHEESEKQRAIKKGDC